MDDKLKENWIVFLHDQIISGGQTGADIGGLVGAKR